MNHSHHPSHLPTFFYRVAVSVDQIALGEAGLVKQAEDYFKENSPWPSEVVRVEELVKPSAALASDGMYRTWIVCRSR